MGKAWLNRLVSEPSHLPKSAMAAIMPDMTLIEITYQLQEPLSREQLGSLGEFANTYGLRRFRVDEAKNQLSFEYDASRLKETEVMHMLRGAKIPVTGRMAIGGMIGRTRRARTSRRCGRSARFSSAFRRGRRSVCGSSATRWTTARERP